MFQFETQESLKNCLARKSTFGNWLSWVHHQARGSTHLDKGIYNLQNKNNLLVTTAHEDSSIDIPTPNMLVSSFPILIVVLSSPSIGTIYRHFLDNRVWLIKICHKKRDNLFLSYLIARWIAFLHLKKFSTTHKDLKWGSSIKTNTLWTC